MKVENKCENQGVCELRKIFWLALMIIILARNIAFADVKSSYDIIISGGGMGGTAAAIQAARMGMQVLIVEPTYMLGGQATTAGVATMDDMSGVESGIYEEFIGNVKKYYDDMRKSIATCYWKLNTRAFEPSVGHKILAEMTASSDVIYHAQIVSVNNNSQDRYVVIKTPDFTRNVKFKILIDASEYGDLIPLVGARYRAGRDISPEIGDVYIQDVTWTTVIRKYPNGVPEHLRPKEPLPDYERARKNYQDYVAKNGTAFTGKYPIKMPVDVATHNAYRAIPDSFTPGSYTGARRDWKKITKTGVNWGNDYPGMYMINNYYGLTVKILEDRKARAEIEREALLKTLHFIYYIQNELAEDWSVDEEEYGELPEAAKEMNLSEEWQNIARHFPPIPYARESRRILGNYTLNSKTIHENSLSWRNNHKNLELEDSIAIAGYNLDLHGADNDEDLESELGEKQRSIHGDTPQGAFQVPMRVLIPETVDNFLTAEKNLSVSRLASSALRLQPICMMTGQAVGTLASLAIIKNLQPREIPALQVQKVLLDSGVVISLAMYEDVPRENKFFKSVQIATLYRLLEPKRIPNLPQKNINSSKLVIKKGSEFHLGYFGVNEKITRKDFDNMLKRAEEITASKLQLQIENKNNITRGEAVDLIVRAMTEQRAK